MGLTPPHLRANEPPRVASRCPRKPRLRAASPCSGGKLSCSRGSAAHSSLLRNEQSRASRRRHRIATHSRFMIATHVLVAQQRGARRAHLAARQDEGALAPLSWGRRSRINQLAAADEADDFDAITVGEEGRTVLCARDDRAVALHGNGTIGETKRRDQIGHRRAQIDLLDSPIDLDFDRSHARNVA